MISLRMCASSRFVRCVCVPWRVAGVFAKLELKKSECALPCVRVCFL